MSYETNEPNSLKDPRYDRMRQPQGRSLTPWIIGGIVALALVIGGIMILPHRTDSTAVNGRPTTIDSATVGSGSASSSTPALGQRPATDH